MKLDLVRLMRGAVLGLWSAFFAWLLLSGEVNRYIGPRTYWVVVFGAVALGLAALAHLGGRARAPRKPSLSDYLAFLALLLPLVAVVAVPAPSLGSLAASKKLGGGGIATGLVAPQALGPGDEVSFAEIEYASESAEYAATLGISDGFSVELTGFVARPEGLASDHFALTRFSIYCCAADVVPHSVTVDATELPDFDEDQWVTVAGKLAEKGGEFVLVPEEATPVEEPKNPYLR